MGRGRSPTPIDHPKPSLEASIPDPAPHPTAADGPSRAACDAFAIVWGSAAGTLERCRGWALLRGGAELWTAPGIAAFGFRRGARSPTKPAALTSWDGPTTSGVFLGELYNPDCIQAAVASSSHPALDRAEGGAPTGFGCARGRCRSGPLAAIRDRAGDGDRAVHGAPTGTGIDGQVVGAASRPQSVGAPAAMATSPSHPAPDRAGGGSSTGAVPVGADPATLIPAAHAAWGDDLFDGLEGVYCLALWDHEQKKLLLYRDASCAKALYWFDGGDWAAAATRLDILTDMPGVGRAIAPAGLHEYLRFLDVSPPNTIYAGIRALEPGVVARVSHGTLDYGTPLDGSKEALIESSVRHTPGSRFLGLLNSSLRRNDGEGLEQRLPEVSHRRSRCSTTGATPTFDASVDALDAALRASVAARLDRGRPTGVFLSGGIDSALLCAIAASIDRDAVDAFTVGFDERGFDERPVAAGIAAHLGVRHHCHAYDMATYARAFDDFVASSDLPFADPAGLPTLLMYRDCRQVVDSVLDGTGADTLLGVMPARHLRIATQYAALLPHTLRHAIAAVLRRIPGAAGYAPVFDFDAPEDLLIRWKGWTRAEIAALTGVPVDLDHTRFFRVYRQFARGDHFERYSALLGNLPDDRVHQAAELTGLYVRFPYGDRRVEQLIRGLPPAYRYTAAEPKRLLRALLGRYVPPHLWDVPKHGFDFPFLSLLQYDSFSLIRRYLNTGLLKRQGLVEARMVEEYVEAFQGGDSGFGFRIWALVVLFAWLEHHQAFQRRPLS